MNLNTASLHIDLPLTTSMISMLVSNPDGDAKEQEPLAGHFGLVIEGQGGWEHFKRIIDAAFAEDGGDLILEVSPPDQNGVAVLIRR